MDISLGDLIEGIALHVFENKKPFTTKTLQHIRKLREIYGLDLTAGDSHKLKK